MIDNENYQEEAISSHYKKEKEYWLARLAGDLVKAAFPYDFKESNREIKGREDLKKEVTYRIPHELFIKITRLSNKSDFRIHVIFTALLVLLLNKYTGETDIMIGSPVLKQDTDLKFINTILILRNRVDNHKTFKEFLLQVWQTMIEAVENVNYPMRTLLYQLKLHTKEDTFPLFDVAILLENIHDKSYLGDIVLNLVFNFRKTDAYIECSVEYNSRLYERVTIEKIITHFNWVTDQVCRDINLGIGKIDMLTEEEKKQVMEYNHTTADYPAEKTVIQLFEEQVRKTPYNIVLIDMEEQGSRESSWEKGRQSTYRQLNEESSRLAHLLRQWGVKPGTIVALESEISIDTVTAIMGILTAGGAYLPIDTQYPRARKKYILEDSQPALWLTGRRPLKSLDWSGRIVEIANIYLESEKTNITNPVNIQAGPGELAYVIYTSGSTGTPKGVMVEHRGLVNYLWWAARKYVKNEKEKFPLYSSISFDLTITSLFVPLISGNGIVIYRMKEYEFSIDRIIDENNVSIIKLTPSHLKLVRERKIDIHTSNIRCLIVGGEKFETSLAWDIYNNWGGRIEIYNEYGPTEAVVGCMVQRYEPGNDQGDSVSIGNPVNNVQVYILSKDTLQLQPIGVAGELCISGASMSRGYLNHPELTAEKFITAHQLHEFHENDNNISERASQFRTHHSPLTTHYSTITNQYLPEGHLLLRAKSQEPRAKLYKTGDLAKWLPDGNIEFLGRIDHQVKIRGFRIELGEIESQLLTYDGIKETVAVAKADEKGDGDLCAYFVSHIDITAEELRNFLSGQLPDYMVPSYFIQVESIPLTPSGKIDRKALPEPGIEKDTSYIEPKNKIERKLAEIWSDVLTFEKEKISTNANFFELGGHSLKAMMMIAKIHKALDVNLPLAAVFKYPTIMGLSVNIREMREIKYTAIEPVEKKEYYVLSSTQRRMYVLQMLELESTAYNTPFVVSPGEDIRKKELEEVFRKLIARHESLRTSMLILDREPIQRIHDEVEFEIEYYDLTTNEGNYKLQNTNYKQIPNCKLQITNKETGSHHSSFIIHHLFVRPFDLSQAPLIRVGLIKQSKEKHLLVVDIHHITNDAVSHEILVGEFMQLYSDAQKQLPPLKLQYKDFAQWQNRQEQQEVFERQGEYWLQVLAGELPILSLPLDFPRPEMQSFEGNIVDFELEKEERENLWHISQESEVTIFMCLLAVFNVLLAKLSGQEDIIVGIPIAARRRAELQNIIGMFVNTLALRNYPQGDKTFRDFLKEVKQPLLNAYENQEYQFEDLVDRLSPPRDTSRNPVFDVMFTFMEQPNSPSPFPQAERSSENDYIHTTSKFDLNLIIVDTGGHLACAFEYCTRLFHETTIHRIIKYFKKIIRQVAENRELELSAVEIITNEEKKQLLYEFNDTIVNFPLHQTLHQWFAEQADQEPDRISLTFINENMTYSELDERANRFAQLLRERGVGPDTIVALMLSRSLELIIGIMGILKAGGAYLPIDLEYPSERIKYTLADSNARFLITSQGLSEKLKKFLIVNSQLLLVNEKPFGRRRIDIPQKKANSINNYQLIINNIQLNVNHLAYVLYTSGSTGNPKGVMLQHCSLVNLLLWGFKYTSLDFSSVLQFATISFDASFHEIFSTLLSGGKLTLIPEELRTEMPGLFSLIERNEIKTAFLPISFLKVIFNDPDHTEMFPGCVRHIQTAGEQVVISERFASYLKANGIYLHNHYGPTEAHVVTSYTVNPVDKISPFPPIGKPVANNVIYILDRYLNLQPIGIVGELFINGIQLGRGYLNRPELTCEKFKIINNLLRAKSQEPRAKFYKTGDLARWLPDGNIEFLGRIDYQIKIRGFRVELGEIESRLLNHPEIKEAVVAAGEEETGDKYLCAYIASPGELEISGLREYLSKILPDYMIPSYFVFLEKIPLTPNGKIDRKALPSPEVKADNQYTAPRNTIEKKLTELWAEVLNVQTDVIGIDRNFFELGGQSLKATILASKVHKELNVKLPLMKIFDTPTIRGLAQWITASGESSYAFSPIPCIEKKEYYEVSHAQKRIWALSQLETASITFNMPMVQILVGELRIPALKQTLQTLLVRHESLCTIFLNIAGEVMQKILPPEQVNFNVELTHLESLPGKEEKARELVETESGIPFDLATGPLLKVRLIRLEKQEYVFFFNIHHIISDFLSQSILFNEMLTLYDAIAASQENPLTPLRIQYKDYTVWHNEQLKGDRMTQYRRYWLNQLKGNLPRLQLPLDKMRPAVQTYNGANIRAAIEEELLDRLRAFSEKQQVTLFMTLLGMVNALFYHYTGQDDMVLGTVIAGREHADLQSQVGYYLNTLALRLHMHAGQSFLDLLENVKGVLIGAYQHQAYPFDCLVEDRGSHREINRHPFFDVMLDMVNYHPPTASTASGSLPGPPPRTPSQDTHHFRVKDFDLPGRFAKFDLAIYFIEEQHIITLDFEYNTDLFEGKSIERMANRFKILMEKALAEPNTPVSGWRLEEKHRLHAIQAISRRK